MFSDLLHAAFPAPWLVMDIHVGLAPQIILTVVAAFFAVFLGVYALRGVWLWLRLGSLARRLDRLRREEQQVAPEKVADLLRTKRLRHAWSEYAETLHEQFDVTEGERRRARVRATVPAEAYFNTQVLVDTPLATEFFKHLPGILTGIGIIGTFYGLVSGLAAFNVDMDPEKLQTSIDHLMAAVKEAFVASGGAIFAAMLVTGLEKLILTGCYNATERVAHAIDALYDAGVGEEYLGRLVESSEENSAQTRMLKDSLVDDLRTLLTELTERQIEASRQHGEMVAGNVGGAIRESLHEPMQALQKAVGDASSSAGEASQKVLADLLSSFTAQLQDTVGGQMRELQQMMAGTTDAIGGMQQNFGELLARMEQTSGAASQQMAKQMTRMMAEAEQRQTQMNDALLGAVNDLRKQMTGGQQDMQAELGRTLDTLRRTLEEMLVEIRRQREEASESTARDLAAVREGLQSAAEAMRDAARDIGQSSTEQVMKLLEDAEARQQRLSDGITSALDAMTKKVGASNDAVQDKTTAALDSIQTAIAGMLDEIRIQREKAAQATEDDLVALRESLGEASDTMRKAAEDIARTSADRNEKAQIETEKWQQENARKAQAALDVMAARMDEFLTAAEEREKRQSEAADAQQTALAQHTAEVLEALDKRLSDLAGGTSRAVTSMQAAIDALNGATGRAIDGMNRGAQTMQTAAEGFTKAGERMETTVDRTGDLLNRVVDASRSLDASVQAVESVVASYNGTRDALKGLAETLEAIVRDADDRAGVSRELVATMRQVVADFDHAQKEASAYLDTAGLALQKGFTDFGDAVGVNMQKSNAAFHKSLSDAVGMISVQIQELEAVLSGFTMRTKTLV